MLSSTLKVKTKQSSLKLKASGDLTIYHKHEEGRITLTVTGPAGAAIAENGIQINTAKTSSVLNNAVEFKDAADNGDGTWTIDYEVTRASLLKNGKSYKLVLSVTPEGNATNKAPQTLNVTLKVKR